MNVATSKNKNSYLYLIRKKIAAITTPTISIIAVSTPATIAPALLELESASTIKAITKIFTISCKFVK